MEERDPDITTNNDQVTAKRLWQLFVNYTSLAWQAIH